MSTKARQLHGGDHADPAIHSDGACPDWLGRLPAEIWSAVFQHLATLTLAGAAPLAEFLDRRLVCKLFDQLIRTEHVAYAAVRAVNGNLLRDARGAPLVKFAEADQDWWDILMDQRRLDRTWFGEGGAATNESKASSDDAAEAARPGYEVLMLDVESNSDTDRLSHYESPCVDICDQDQAGVLGFVAYRTHTPPAPPSSLDSGRQHDKSEPFSYITVHILDYPSLRPIVTHSLLHRGFGSLQDKCDLRSVAPDPKRPENMWLLPMAQNWTATLGHVDCENKLYSLICTDESRASLVHLRSYACDEETSSKLVTGRTKASIVVVSDHVDMNISLIPSQPNLIRIVSVHRISRLMQVLNLDRTTFAYVSETSIDRTQVRTFHYSPAHHPDLIALLLYSGCVFISNVNTGAKLTALYLPREASASGQKAHGATFRPLLSRATPHHAAPAQWLVEWVQKVQFAGHENHLWRTNKCGVQIQSDFPTHLWPHVLNTFAVPPVQSRAVLGAHVYLVLSPNGEISVTDMRSRGEEARRIWNVGAKFTRGLDSKVAERHAGSEEDAFEAVVRRVAPEDVERIMCEYASQNVQAQAPIVDVGREVKSVQTWTNESSVWKAGEDSEQEAKDEDDEGDEGDEDDEDHSTVSAHIVALGARGDAVLVQRGPVISVLRRCGP